MEDKMKEGDVSFRFSNHIIQENTDTNSEYEGLSFQKWVFLCLQLQACHAQY